MNIKLFTDVEHRINEVNEDTQNKIEEYTSKIAQLKTSVAQLDTQLDEAMANDELDRYKKLKSDKESELAFIDTYTKKIKDLRTGHLITEQEYNNLVNDILAEIDKANAVYSKKCIELFDKLEPLCKEFDNVLVTGEKLMAVLQRNMYKGVRVFPTGAIVPLDPVAYSREKRRMHMLVCTLEDKIKLNNDLRGVE